MYNKEDNKGKNHLYTKETMIKKNHKGLVFLLALSLSMISFFKASPSIVAASTFSVTRFDDPAPGSCDPGDCSLREAITAANTSPGSDTIDLPSGTYALSIFGKGDDANLTGDLDILSGLTINGLTTGATITAVGGWDDRIIDSPVGGFTVELSGLTINGGNLTGDDGGGIRSYAALTSLNNIIAHNQADSGAGLAAHDTLYMVSTLVSQNVSVSTVGGGLSTYNPGIIILSTIAGNQASTSGGGIYDSGSSLQIGNTTISGNSAAWFGGGIEVTGGTLILSGSTISGNTSSSNGSGIDSFGNLSINNSTISGNISTSGLAGGIIVSGPVTVSMNNSTVAFNQTSHNPGTGGIYVDPNATFTILNTILANNHNLTTFSQDCTGTLVANDYNLVKDFTGCTLTTGTHNLTGLDPLLSTLGNHGGKTSTHSLLSGSPALDAGNPLAPGGGGLACMVDDQINQIRPIGAVCDIGAFEGIRNLFFIPLVAK